MFPTVVICPNNPSDEELVNETAYRTLGGYEDDYEQYIPFLDALTSLSYETLKQFHQTILNLTTEVNVKNKNLRELAFKVAIKCESVFLLCKYRDDPIDCCDYFLPIYTEHGYCFAFNARYVGSAGLEYDFSFTKINY